MKKAIELKLIDINLKIEKIEKESPIAFTTVEWKVLHGQRTVLAEVLNAV